MEMLIGWVSSQLGLTIIGSVGGLILAWIMKRIPNDKIKAAVGGVAYRLGVALTLGLSKWKVTARFWDKYIEPWFIDLVDNVIGEAVREFIRGLRSDNPT
jgi:hypothetical protein